jgi:hypothetical protein
MLDTFQPRTGDVTAISSACFRYDPVAVFAQTAASNATRSCSGAVPQFRVFVSPPRFVRRALAIAGFDTRVVTITAVFSRRGGADVVGQVKVHAGRSAMAKDMLARWSISPSGEVRQVPFIRHFKAGEHDLRHAFAELEAFATDIVALAETSRMAA